jgi:integrase
MHYSRIHYYLKRPAKEGYKFTVCKLEYGRDGSRKFVGTLDSGEVGAINEAYLAKTVDKTSADIQLKKLCDDLNAIEKKRCRGEWTANEDNLKLLAKYWDDVYRDRRCNKTAAYNRLRQVIEALGQVPLLAAKRTVQDHIDKIVKGDARKQRRFGSLLNQMRKHFGITERISLEQKQLPEFCYLTWEEFQQVLPHVEDEECKDLFMFLFGTGCRLGEGFAFPGNACTDRGVVRITKQVRYDGSVFLPKNRKQRTTLLLPECRERGMRWVAYGPKAEMHKRKFDTILKLAAQKAFPGRPDKWVTPHDLRHSFAVHMLQIRRTSISMVAKLLGDSVTVTEDYYLNFALHDEVIESLLG